MWSLYQRVLIYTYFELYSVAMLTSVKGRFFSIRPFIMPSSNHDHRSATTRKAHVLGLSMGLSEAFTYFTFAAVFGYGAVLIRDGETQFLEVME